MFGLLAAFGNLGGILMPWLVGVTGFEEDSRATVAALNAAFAANQWPARCLPLGVGSMKLFGKVIDAVKLAAVVVDETHRRAILGVAVGRLRRRRLSGCSVRRL